MTPGQLLLFLLERLKLDAEADITASYNVLNLELGHLDRCHQRFALFRSRLLDSSILWPAIEHLLDGSFEDFPSPHGPFL